jgi:hypothetical protein
VKVSAQHLDTEPLQTLFVVGKNQCLVNSILKTYPSRQISKEASERKNTSQTSSCILEWSSMAPDGVLASQGCAAVPWQCGMVVRRHMAQESHHSLKGFGPKGSTEYEILLTTQT